MKNDPTPPLIRLRQNLERMKERLDPNFDAQAALEAVGELEQDLLNWEARALQAESDNRGLHEERSKEYDRAQARLKTEVEKVLAETLRLEKERDAARAELALLKNHYSPEAAAGLRAQLATANAEVAKVTHERDAALAQVEALRGPMQRLVDVCAGRWLPAGHGFTMEERDVALATAAQALSSTPAPAVYTRERALRAFHAAMAYASSTGRVSPEAVFLEHLDAQPATREERLRRLGFEAPDARTYTVGDAVGLSKPEEKP